MMSAKRTHATLLICGWMAVAFALMAGSGGAPPASGASIPVQAPFLSQPLVIPAMGLLDAGEQEQDQLTADRAAPGAVVARWRSRTQYEHLNSAAAARVLAESVPAVVAQPLSGLGRLPKGAHVSGYLGATSARIALPNGGRALVDSLVPLATRNSSGGYAPLDLSVRASGGRFVANRPAVPVGIPQKLASGVKVGSDGVSLTPVNGAGAPLSGVGRVDGGAVVYTNTGVDADTAIKPIPTGAETFSTLRSIYSPQRLFYKIGAPAGASLVPDPSGAVRIIAAGHVLAVIPAASAVDAAGTPVQTKTTLSGVTLRVEVDHRSGDYRYPITVDPVITDTNSSGNWRSETSSYPGAFRIEQAAGRWTISNYNKLTKEWLAFEANEWGALLYPTQGESHIYEISMETSSNLSWEGLESHLAILGPGGWEASAPLPAVHSAEWSGVCVTGGCPSTSGTAGNVATYWINATVSGPKTTGWKAEMDNAYVYISQNNGPAANFSTATGWVTEGTTAAVLHASDPGVGIKEAQFTAAGQKWTEFTECAGDQCPESPGFAPIYYKVGGVALPDGEPTIEAKVINAMGSSYTTTAKLRVDGTPPHEVALTGLPSDINETTTKLKLTGHATDGVTGTPSSGVASLKLTIDGQEIGSPNGKCSPGPCSASGEWTISGSNYYAAGRHTYVLTATDAAGNSATSEGTFTVHHAAPISMGPGTLDPVTGEFDLEEEDISLTAPGAPLTITRNYNSKKPTAGGAEAFGAPWTTSFGGAQKLVDGYGTSMILVSASGAETIFHGTGEGKYESRHGDSTLTLTGGKAETEFTLSDNGATTKFTHISGDTEGVYRASLATGTGGTHAIQYTYQVVGGVLEPLQELAPVPAGVSCAPALKPGCRALSYNFAKSTTATGEGPSQWGDYSGRLTRVYFSSASENAKGELSPYSITVAQYAYDSKGRLRAVWDPRIGTLKTTYGYDSEGHVTAITPPGKETWAFTYGTTSADSSPGRLLKVYRPPASESLWSGEAPSNTTAPSLSGTAMVGVRMAVSNGVWSGGPVAYGYQWEDCNYWGLECTLIPGAVNANYTPVASDVGYTLVASVMADNGGGAVSAVSAKSATVVTASSAHFSYTQAVDPGNSLNAVSCIHATMDCVASDSKGNVFYSTSVEAGYAATWSSWTGPGESPSEALSCPSTSLCVIAAGEKKGGGDMYYATSLGGSWTVAFKAAGGADSISCSSASFCFEGQVNGIFRYSSSPGSTSWLSGNAGGYPLKGVFCLSSAFCAVSSSNGVVRVGTSSAQIESGSWTESNVDSGAELNGVSCTSTTSCVAVDSVGNVLNLTIAGGGEATANKQNIAGPDSLKAVTCTSAVCVTVDDHGDVFISRDSGKTWTIKYQLETGLTSVSCSATTLCVATDTAGDAVSFNPEMSGLSGSEAHTAQPGTTIEYGVPVSGAGAPYSMSGTEVARWAQTDVPTEATAVFPPEEPMGWPASDYHSATVDYLDAYDRLVNVADPAGGIVTSEYNSYNDVVRNLSADNRAAALKEGAKSAEVSQTLDTQSSYGEEGSELLSTLGPLHNIMLASGSPVQARKHTVYSYDEGAPATGGPYRLVTKVTEGAQMSGETEADVRTTTTSYAGQNNLGWVLRKPTAKRVDPTGLKLIYSTIYDPSTGNVLETRTPGAGAPNEETFSGDVYRSSFGSAGNESGQLSKPMAVTKDAEGNFWVADTANNRIEEFSSGGTFIRKFGTSGTGNGQLKSPEGVAIDSEGQVWVTDTGNNRVQVFSATGTYLFKLGMSGSCEGELKFICFTEPTGIAYSPRERAMFVVDTGNDRVQEIAVEKSWYEYVRQFGGTGTEKGDLKKPRGIAIESQSPYHVWVADTGNNRIQEYTQGGGTYVTQIGSLGSGNGQLSKPEDVVIDSEGNVLVADSGNNRIESFSASGAYQSQFGALGSGEKQMSSPAALTLDSSNDAYVLDTGNNRIEKWQPSSAYHESSGTGGTHGEQTVYYGASENAEVPACGQHAEWADLPCETRPAAQPETSGVPNLPVTTVTYNTWDEPAETKETVGTSTRTTGNYYEGERLWAEHVSSSVGTALPWVFYEYNRETGDLSKQEAFEESEGREETVGVVELTRNRLGQLTSYKDADGNTSTYSYDAYGRLESFNDGKGTQTYGYDPTTGLLDKLADSAAGTFTAIDDVEGNLISAGYPNGMNVNHTFDSTGSETGREYVKTTHCSSGCVWYSQSEWPSIDGQTINQTSTLSSQTYTYDAAGRLTKTQDTPAGEGCTTRIYAYDQETNIDSLTTRSPGTGGACATEGGSAVNHSYDPANRLTDGGISYDAFGDITKLPATDAGGHELNSTFYADETLASQTQNGQTIGYHLDPEGRDRQIVSTGTINSTVTYHYAGGGDSPAWTEDTAGKWTRNIYGFEGLVAIQSGGESPALQIQDLKGDVVGIASLSETATGLLSKGDGTEYGVPRTSSPPKYSWQGGSALRTELPSGVIAMGARSYVPQIGRFLQPDPIEGGSANEYAYTYGDPVNSADPSGEFTVGTPSWVSGFFDEQAEIATEAAIQRVAEEQAAREEAEEKAREAAEEAAEAAEAASEAAAESSSGGGGKKGKGKGKKGKAKAGKPVKVAKAAKSKADITASRKVKGKSCTGPGPYKCAKPGTGTKTIKEGKKDGGKAVREQVGGVIEKAGEEWEQSEREKAAAEEWEECWYHEAC